MSQADSNTRSIVKALSYRLLGTLATLLVAWHVTGKWDLAADVALLDFFGKILLFWLHERLWVRIK